MYASEIDEQKSCQTPPRGSNLFLISASHAGGFAPRLPRLQTHWPPSLCRFLYFLFYTLLEITLFYLSQNGMNHQLEHKARSAELHHKRAHLNRADILDPLDVTTSSTSVKTASGMYIHRILLLQELLKYISISDYYLSCNNYSSDSDYHLTGSRYND